MPSPSSQPPDDPPERRTHPVQTYGRRFRFGAYVGRAHDSIVEALKMCDEPIMRQFLEPIGRGDVIQDLKTAQEHLANVLADLDALPPKVEFRLKDE